MTIAEKLQEEFNCAINAELGDVADQEYEEGSVSKEALSLIANKVAFYLDL
jgi:hypothetical protein